MDRENNNNHTQGLEYLNKDIPPVAEELYEDERMHEVLNADHRPRPEDLNLVNDMISRIRKVSI